MVTNTQNLIGYTTERKQVMEAFVVLIVIGALGIAASISGADSIQLVDDEPRRAI
jgi:hypothetical protein